MELEIRDLFPAEQKYSYTQSSQIMAQTGCIGHLRADMDTSGEGFFTSWTDHMGFLKTDGFKEEFNGVIRLLRFSPKYGKILKNRTELMKYCTSHPACQMDDGKSFGIRADTDRYSYLLRLNPEKGDYNAYVYAYKREWLDHHLMQAKSGIRFIDTAYREQFRIPDGGMIKITMPSGETVLETCRYVDPYHMEVGSWLCHICEFAERMEKNGNTVLPALPQTEKQDSRKEMQHAGLSR